MEEIKMVQETSLITPVKATAALPAAESHKTIASFLSGKNIFITGATGFLGQCIIERLLNATPSIGKIYILIRAKHGFSPESRIAKLLSKALFDHLSTDDKRKVIPVVGELTVNNFGFNDDVLEKLYNEVNIVFHSAATIKFNTHLATAIKINLVGTKVVIDFVKNLRNLASFVHISTAFCNSCYLNQGIKEQVYASECDPYDMMKLVDGNNNMADKLPQTGTPELQAILKSHPNTYTFTKQMAENLILMELKNYPVGICRPSVVYGTHKQPFPGWLGSANNGHIGFVAGFTKGLFRTMGGDESSIMDLIPVDYVTNSIITLAWYVATRKIEEPEVIHCTSGEINPLSFGEYCKILNNASKKHPNDFIICQPRVKVRNGLRYTLFVYMFNFLPALIIWLPEHLLWRRKALRTTLDYVRIYDNGIKAFDYFTNKNFHYNMKNSLRILNELEDEDQVKYNYNVKFCEWSEYMESQVVGVRKFFYRESKDTTTAHRAMWHIYGVVQFFWYVAGFYILNAVLSTFMETPISIAIVLCILLFIKWI